MLQNLFFHFHSFICCSATILAVHSPNTRVIRSIIATHRFSLSLFYVSEIIEMAFAICDRTSDQKKKPSAMTMQDNFISNFYHRRPVSICDDRKFFRHRLRPSKWWKTRILEIRYSSKQTAFKIGFEIRYKKLKSSAKPHQSWLIELCSGSSFVRACIRSSVYRRS